MINNLSRYRETAVVQHYLNDFKKYDPENGERLFEIIFDCNNSASPTSVLEVLNKTLWCLQLGADYTMCKTLEDIIIRNLLTGYFHALERPIEDINSLLNDLMKEESNDQ